MNQAFKIIEMLHKQTPIEEIEKEVHWESLSQADYENLLTEVDLLRGSKRGFDLLGLMYKAAKDRDYWIETRILAAVISRPEADIEKSKLLKRMSYCLEQIRSSMVKISKSDPLQLRYRRYLCDYVFLSACLLEEAGDIDNALKEYTAAQKAYTEYNFLAQAQEIDEPIGRLQRLKKQGDQLISINAQIDRKGLLEKEISDLGLKAQGISRLLEESSILLQNKEAELLNLNLIVEELDNRVEASQKSLQQVKDETTELENRRENSRALIEQVEQEKSALVEQIITLREQAQSLDTRVAQTALKLNDRLAALQAQIDMKNVELEKIESVIRQKKDISEDLEQTIALRRQELAALEETLHHEEGYLVEISKRRAQIEAESYPEHAGKEEPILEDSATRSQDELAVKLERYKKNLKASRTRKKAKTSLKQNETENLDPQLPEE